MRWLARLGDAIWFPWMLGLFLLVGLYYSLRTGFFQLFGLKTWWKATAGSLFTPKKRTRGGVSQLQALSTALAATIGTGSIAGVATAVFFGGPGAVFWMWLSALLGMMTGCAEKTLAVRYRERSPEGGWRGGPMCYIREGLSLLFLERKRSKKSFPFFPNRSSGSWKSVPDWLAAAFSILCVAQTLCGGNLVQANSIAVSLNSTFGVSKLTVGIVTAALAGVVTLGGIGRIGRVSERLVPVMAALFIGGGAVVLATHAQAIPGAFRDIVRYAFQPRAVLGGYGMGTAMRFGIARGVFTNEAGLGTSAIAHAAADVDDPAEQGMWGIFEVFAATMVVCSVTALVILTSGVYSVEGAQAAIRCGNVPEQMLGAPLTGAAFGTALGKFGPVLVSVCLLLFAFTSLLGSCYYGQRGIEFLTGKPWAMNCYRGAYLAMVVLGCLGDVTVVWQLVDVIDGLLALPNLIALLLLSPEAVRLIRVYSHKKQAGRI